MSYNDRAELASGVRKAATLRHESVHAYLFGTFPASRASLAIKPQWSTMSGFRQFQIRTGATFLEGQTAAQSPYLQGGQTQKFILDWQADLIAP